jgi:glucose/arabinose dehydrogenase
MGDKYLILLVTELPPRFSWLGLLFVVVILLISRPIIGHESDLVAEAASSDSNSVVRGSPEISGMPDLDSEVVLSGIEYPTAMAFLGLDDMLVLEQDKGTVQRVFQGQVLDAPVLDVNVANERDRFGIHEERGLLGIAIAEDDENSKTPRYVFLYYTEAEEQDGGEPLGNRLYRYEFLDNELVNPKLLLDLPVSNDNPAHNGGVIKLGPDGNVYVAIGNLLGPGLSEDIEHTLDQNIEDGDQVEGTGGILRISQEGEVVDSSGILGEGHPLDKYFAYGIRNSFGMDFDPVTGNLWDTENGPSFGDEINLVFPGFNSGWAHVLGGWYVNETINEESEDREVNKGQETSFLSPDQSNEPRNLVTFDNLGNYSDPEFVWDRSIGPTSIIFVNSDKLGKDFENDIFVADVEGKIHNFNLVANRTQLDLSGTLSDKVANNPEELGDSIFASNFDIITDLEVGPDGYLYVLAGVRDVEGRIYKITYGSSAES